MSILSALQLTFAELSFDTFNQMRRATNNNSFTELSRNVTQAEWEALSSDFRPPQTSVAPMSGTASNSSGFPGTVPSGMSSFSAAGQAPAMTGTYDFQSSVKRVANTARQNQPWPQGEKKMKKGFWANLLTNPATQEILVFAAFIATKTLLYLVFKKAQQKNMQLPD